MLETKCYRFFNNFSNPLRIQIIELLRKKEMSVNEMVKELKVEQSKLSHALTKLRGCKIILFKSAGKKRIYSINKDTIEPILCLIEKHIKINCKNECKIT